MSNIEKNKPSITQYLSSEAMQKYLQSVIGSNKDKFVTNLVSAVNQNKALQECTNQSLVSCALVATTLNLSLNSTFGYAYAVPYKNKREGITEAQFQIGYKGYIQLALRTGEYQRINAVPVYRSQFMSWNALTEDLKLSSFDDFEDDEVVGYVAFFRLNNGFEKTMFWSKEKMMRHADKYSQAFSISANEKLQKGQIPEKDLWKYSSYWYKDFDGMALKTMLRQVLGKYGIMSEEMMKAYVDDQTVIVDNQNFIEEPKQERISLNSLVQEHPKESKFDYFFSSRGIPENEKNEFIDANGLTDDDAIEKFLNDQSGAESLLDKFYEQKDQ